MTTAELMLWNKIKAFQFDDEAVSFKFSNRVARENGWTKSYTFRVINEYKKFVFLCCISENGITPSDPVDQVWHLHLTFTKSYWTDFCKNTLQKEIHHNPTKGGMQEGVKFNDFYTNTKQIYISKFAEDPPVDMWQPNAIRFTDINFQRINLAKYWLIKKPTDIVKKQMIILGLIVIGLTFIQATGKYLPITIFAVIIILLLVFEGKNKGKGKEDNNTDSGCSTSGCSVDSGHHGDSGSGSGCSGSGCSGCGGGGD